MAIKKNSALPKRALTPIEVEKVYGVPVGSLANMRSKQQGAKFYKVGRKVVYKPEDIERFLFRNPVLTIDSVEEVVK